MEVKGWTNISIPNSVLIELEKIRKEAYQQTGIYMRSYRQIIEYLIEHYRKG